MLIISITNNYLLYNKKSVIGTCPEKLINKIPFDTELINISFFYKKKPYNKCYKNDLKNNINSKEEKRFQGEMIIKYFLNNITNKYSDNIYYLINDNKSKVNLSNENILNIKKLS